MGSLHGYAAFYCHDIANLIDPSQSVLEKLHELVRAAQTAKKGDVN